MNINHSFPAALSAVAILVFPVTSPVLACEWTGGGAGNAWSEAANWTACAGAVPQPGDGLLFADGAGQKHSVNDIVGLDVGQIVITGWDFDIEGEPIGLEFGISVNLPAPSPFSRWPEIALDITLLQNQDFLHHGPSGALRFHGDIDLNGSELLLHTIGGGFNMNGNISGHGLLMKLGTHAGAVVLLAGTASDYTGPTVVAAGRLMIASSQALGASGPGNGTVVLDGATLELGGALLLEEDLSLAGNGIDGTLGALFNSPGSPSTVTGAIELTGDTLVRKSSLGVLTLAGPISGAFSLTKSGSHPVVLQGANSYSGFTTVEEGELLIHGDQPQSDVFVSGSGILGGTGRVGSIINTSGTVRPGASPGILNAQSAHFFTPSTMEIILQGPNPGDDYNQLEVGPSGLIISQATLELSTGFEAAAGTEFVIINQAGADPVQGEFDGLPEGAQFAADGHVFRISYSGGNGNDVVLTALGKLLFSDRFESP